MLQSNVCYIKASLPQILELLRTHFNYVRNSDNRRYVNTLETVIYHLYTQGCVPEISEEFEVSTCCNSSKFHNFTHITLSYREWGHPTVQVMSVLCQSIIKASQPFFQKTEYWPIPAGSIYVSQSPPGGIPRPPHISLQKFFVFFVSF